MAAMVPPPAAAVARRFQPGRSALRWLITWWQIIHLGALVAALALSPGSYSRQRWPLLAKHLVQAAWPVLPWFGLVSALISLVIARIVLVTAASYGLDQFALGMVVRVLVLELIPLSAALFVAVRITVPAAGSLAVLRTSDDFAALRRAGGDPLRDEIAPRVLASLVSVLLLAALASVISLALAYLLVHGFTPWGFERFTRQVGQVFTPAVSLIFMLKTLAFGAAVSVVPLGSALHDPVGPASPLPLELQGLVRLLMALLAVEVVSLVGNYY
jgi:phospholipid/cholesterol/gamma-HCH transport system permease protein